MTTATAAALHYIESRTIQFSYDIIHQPESEQSRDGVDCDCDIKINQNV